LIVFLRELNITLYLYPASQPNVNRITIAE